MSDEILAPLATGVWKDCAVCNVLSYFPEKSLTECAMCKAKARWRGLDREFEKSTEQAYADGYTRAVKDVATKVEQEFLMKRPVQLYEVAQIVAFIRSLTVKRWPVK